MGKSMELRHSWENLKYNNFQKPHNFIIGNNWVLPKTMLTRKTEAINIYISEATPGGNFSPNAMSIYIIYIIFI